MAHCPTACTEAPNVEPEQRVISEPATAKTFNISPATLRRLWRAGLVPAHVWLNAQRIGCRSEAIDAWLDIRTSKAAAAGEG
jgi:predicted DNA-binding transcriptional regulator AlpA